MDAKLQKAVEIFKKYGWEEVTAENILELPIGTPEEQKTALNGLKSGEWGEDIIYGEGHYSFRRFFQPEYETKLGLFAIRIGVTGARASELVSLTFAEEEAIIKILKKRGSKFASEMLIQTGTWFMGSHYELIMRIIDEMELPIPQNEEYLQTWAEVVAQPLGVKSTDHCAIKIKGITLDIFEKSFAQHIRAGMAINIPSNAFISFASVTAAGVKRGLMPRDEAIELIFSALDSAVRPIDRATWVKALEELNIPNDEYIQRIQSLIPILSTGDNTVVSKIAPILIEQAPLQFLTEVLLASFSCNTKKAKKMLLNAALQREKPPNADDLSSWLSVFAADSDKTIASLSKKLSEKWETDVEEFEEEEISVTGLWKETPPVWEVPDFEVGEVSPEILTELAAEIVARPVDNMLWDDVIHDVLVERFLAAINIVALEDKQKAREALCGLNPKTETRLINRVAHWAKGIKRDAPQNIPEYKMPIISRDYAVSFKFGEVPCFLSTPSKLDLSITVSDLISRLHMYEEKGIDALEADLFLALTRLDTKTEKREHKEQLENIKILIRLHSDKPVKLKTKLLTAGQAVINYLNNPVTDIKIIQYKGEECYEFTQIKAGKAFDGFPVKFNEDYGFQDYSTFPCLSDNVLHDICWYSNTAQHEMGLIMRQAACRATPFSPALAINFLGVMRTPSQQAAADAALAIQEAFERGLLRPKTPDIKYLDWSAKPPSNLATLAAALENIARDDVLSVVWYVLDDLIGASLAAPKMLTGTAQIAEVILSLLPEVQFAVENNIAPASALDLPNTRELAKRKGSSQAISTAKKIAELLNE